MSYSEHRLFKWAVRSHVRLRNWCSCAQPVKHIHVRHPVRQHNTGGPVLQKPEWHVGEEKSFRGVSFPTGVYWAVEHWRHKYHRPINWDSIALHFWQFILYLSWNNEFHNSKEIPYIELDCFLLSNNDLLFACI